MTEKLPEYRKQLEEIDSQLSSEAVLSDMKQYKALMRYDGVELEFEPDALGAIADKAIEMKIGARGLRSVMEKIMTDIMYAVPSDPTIEKVVVTADCVRGGTEPLVIHGQPSDAIVS